MILNRGTCKDDLLALHIKMLDPVPNLSIEVLSSVALVNNEQLKVALLFKAVNMSVYHAWRCEVD